MFIVPRWRSKHRSSCSRESECTAKKGLAMTTVHEAKTLEFNHGREYSKEAGCPARESGIVYLRHMY